MQQERLVDVGKHVGDVGALSTVAATLFGWLPEATALLSFIWIAIRVYETKTVSDLIHRLRGRKG